MSKSGDDKKGDGRRRKSRFDSEERDTQEKLSELDPTSSNFNPLKSLYASNPFLPDPKAPTYDNLSKYESVMKGKAATAKPSKEVTKRLEYEDLPPRDLTDTFDNVMKWMRNAEGPMKVLRDCMEKKTKVKIFTRSAERVRGHVIGYVTAFDKLWNMAVEDATEVWTRKKKKKTIPVGGASQIVPSNTMHLRMTAPPIKITRDTKKTEKCQRKVPKMLVRGEHVVLVSIIDY